MKIYSRRGNFFLFCGIMYKERTKIDMNILLVEDSLSIVKGLKYSFEKNNDNLIYKTNVKDTIQYLEKIKAKLIL